MRTNAYQQYVEDEILTADPIRLVQLLYKGAMEAVVSARSCLARGDIKGRSTSTTRAIQILAELSFSLNHEAGGELSARLAALYDYMQRRLIDGNQEQIDPPFAEVEKILGTLGEAWLIVQEAAAQGAGTNLPNRAKATSAGIEEQAMNAAPPEYVPLSCAC